jgi:gamma-glutamyltranspeptidase/glutathione hydrolase
MCARLIRIFVKLHTLSLGLFTSCLIMQNSYAVYPLPLKSTQGMVVTEQALASKVGVDILQQGGNAIDAAVAVGYALAVTQPCCGNLGGGGFMLVHLAQGKNIFINFREKAPLAITSDVFLDKNGNLVPNKSLLGYTAVAVPGTVMGLEHALKKYGTMSRDKVMAPAIQLAKEGFIVTEQDVPRLAKIINGETIAPNVATIFLQDGKPYQVGQKLIQANLGNTLQRIASQGIDPFYKGSIAAEIVKASQNNGGYLSMEDFAQYSVQELTPLSCDYRGYTIISAPPPSSGGVVLCEMLAILEGYDLAALGYHSAQSAHYIIEAMRYAFADRNNKLGDPDFIKNPIKMLISKEYAKGLRENIQDYKATPSSELPYKSLQLENTDTTHYSIADKAGNLVAVTYTLNGMYGARVIAGQTGFFLNDEMDDFAAKVGANNQFGLVQGYSNSIQPGKRPLSSMTPTIVFHNDKPVLVLGSPGGSRIITSL